MLPSRYEISFSEKSRRDLRQIYDYIAKDSRPNASKMVVQLIDAAESLALFPHRFNVPRNRLTGRRNIRSMPFPPYLIRYRIDDHHMTVYILSIRHGARRS